MPIRRSLPLGLCIAAAFGLGSTFASAQPAPAPAPPAPPVAPAGPATPAAPPAAPAAPAAAPSAAPDAGSTVDEDSIRFTFTLHGGFTYRVGKITPEPDARGGGLVGLDALIGSNKWWAAGVGFDHAFLGNEREDTPSTGAFTRTNRALEELWVLGRFYPWQNDAVALFLQLGIGPAWQSVNRAGMTASTDVLGHVNLTPSSCTGRATPGLGLRGGAGIDIAVNNTIIFYGDVGVDHFRLSSGDLGGCANGIGASTFLATRFGIALATGRVKAAPPPDRDRDGVPDAADACPDLAGPPSDDPKKNGCPDKDGDKVIDPIDACPEIPGKPSEDPKENGCPPDTDGDGIRDDKDACPADKGLPNEDPSKHGCPLVIVRESEIVISQQVQFQVDKSIIKKESDELLDGIAKVLKDHPEILKVEVQGHTDATGNKQRNKVLSNSRAEAVKRALTKRGVKDKRLIAKGYGQEKPIADNDTDAGKAKNRRVQFVILEKTPAEPKK